MVSNSFKVLTESENRVDDILVKFSFCDSSSTEAAGKRKEIYYTGILNKDLFL